MKSFYLSAIFMVLGITASFSQVPDLFNYQAIVRDGSGQVIDNQIVGIKISILQSTSTGSEVFSETHTVTTNNYGLVNLQIGNGTNIGPQLNTIIWDSDLYFIKVEIDPAGGVAYSLSSTSQLISVPYALHAETVTQKEYNTSAVLNGTDLELSDAGGMLTVDLSGLVNDADANPTNEIQTITKVGSIITLSLGGGAVTDNVNDADSNPTNELNTGATLVGTTLNITDAGGTIPVNLSSLGNDADANPTNEMNTGLTLVGTTLNVIDGGGTQSVDLAAIAGDDADADPTNEMNSGVTLVGTTLNVIDGGGTQSVDLAAIAGDDADADPINEMNSGVTLVGTTLNVIDGGGTQSVDLATLGDDADADPANEIQTLTLVGSDLSISGGNTVTLGGGTDSQTLSIVGSDLTILNGNTVTLPGGGTDTQTLSLAGTNLTISTGNTVDLISLGDDADANPTNEMNTAVTLVGTTLNVIDAGSTQSVDLASLGNDADANPTNEMNVDVTLVGTTLNVIDGGSTQSVDLVSLGNDADANPTNEMNTDVTLVGTILNVIDAGSTQSVDLASLGGGTDSQTLSISGADLTISGGNTITIPVQTHHVGEHFGGGIIVWVDSTGEHGIISAYADLVGTFAFQTVNSATLITSNMTNGAVNTPLLVAAPSGPYPAAVAADASADGGFTDWYLPAAYELELLLMSNYVLGQYALLRGGTNFYWSSSQDPLAAGVNAYRTLGGPINISSFGEANTYLVRCVRAF